MLQRTGLSLPALAPPPPAAPGPIKNLPSPPPPPLSSQAAFVCTHRQNEERGRGRKKNICQRGKKGEGGKDAFKRSVCGAGLDERSFKNCKIKNDI